MTPPQWAELLRIYMRMSTPSPIKDLVSPAGLVTLLGSQGEKFRQGSRSALFFFALFAFHALTSILASHFF
jgi:hypothetical protein